MVLGSIFEESVLDLTLFPRRVHVLIIKQSAVRATLEADTQQALLSRVRRGVASGRRCLMCRWLWDSALNKVSCTNTIDRYVVDNCSIISSQVKNFSQVQLIVFGRSVGVCSSCALCSCGGLESW